MKVWYQVDLVFDVVFIKILNMGVFGAAMATALSFFFCFVYFLWFFIYRSELRLKLSSFVFKPKLSKEIISLSTKNCEKLIELNCKAIVVACNTATTNAIERHQHERNSTDSKKTAQSQAKGHRMALSY